MQQVKSSDEPRARAATPVYYGWVVAAACFVVISLVSPLIASFSVFYVAVLDDFKWGRGQLSIALAIHLVCCGAAAPFVGGLIDRYGPRRVMPVGVLVTAAALISLSRATALWHFYVGFGVLAAVGSSMLHIVPLTAIVSNWFVRNRGTAIGIVTGGSGAGQLFMLPLLQHLIERAGWRGAYLALGLAILFIPTALIWRFVYTRPEDRGLTVADERPGEAGGGAARGGGARGRVVVLDEGWAATDWTVGRAARSFRFWALTAVMALFAAGFFLISVQLVAYLADEGYGALLAASVVGLQGLLNVAGKFAGGLLCDRVGREKTMTLSIVLFVVCIVLLNLAGAVHSAALVYVFAVFYGLGYGMALPALMTSAADLFQGRRFGSILGVITLGGFLGGAVGTWLGGHFYDLTGAYRVNFLIAGLAMLASAALMWKARPGRVRGVRAAAGAQEGLT
ncbi:MAG TPA: MFS transporter [Pyrinomonadaceae bacterium]|nr:MFS transporter [Pyrinomonadaceae bacterium]